MSAVPAEVDAKTIVEETAVVVLRTAPLPSPSRVPICLFAPPVGRATARACQGTWCKRMERLRTMLPLTIRIHVARQ